MNRKLLVFLIAGMFWMPSNAQEVPKDQITISPNDCITPNLLGMDPNGSYVWIESGFWEKIKRQQVRLMRANEKLAAISEQLARENFELRQRLKNKNGV